MRGSFALLICVVAAGFVGCRSSQPGIQPDSKLADLVPSTATAVAGLNLDELKRSELYQRHANLLKLEVLNAVSEAAGLDPRRDISSVLVFIDNNQPGLLLRGSFSRETVTSKLLARGGRTSVYHGKTLIEGVRISNTVQTIYFPRNGIAAVALAATLRRNIDAEETGMAEDLKAALRALREGDQIWFSMEGAIPTGQITARSDIGSMLTSLAGFLNSAAGSIGLDSGVHARIDLSCRSEDAARQVRDAFHGMISFGRMGARDSHKDLLPIYDAIRVAQEKQAVQVQVELAPEMSEKVLDGYLGR
jgi:hypothetical protein